MTTEHETARIVRSWLGTDEHESADHVLDTVLALLDATPQRRSWRPVRRIADMNIFAKLAGAVAALVFVAVVGITLFPRGGGVGGATPTVGPTPTVAPTPTATVAPTRTPSPTAVVVIPPAGELTVGRHTMTLNNVPFSFAVSTPGWVSNGSFGFDRTEGIGPKGAGFILWGEAPVGVYADPCKETQGPVIGNSTAGLAAAVASVPGTKLVSGPTNVTVGGRPAKLVVVGIPDVIGCAPSDFYLWYAPQPDLARYATAPGSTIRAWIIDVGGKIVWIDGETYQGAGPGPARQLQDIIDSIRFE